ncbi:hypothetical protein STP4a_226 [Salmonella phage STP4-a]|uniref:DUF7247 domain-containing protein n=1 Tax=Salmonella phage STP4-a TaxID=1445860 RepID=A0A0B4L9Z4_9CAUD|nr:hypothetical protein STP4a_226 [Salmonella phage STP4-a]AHJ86823.1 hypothetical protein STP4a_226 [Salmonella phage STP4-a]UFK27094.1 hypothetical protein LG358_00073 [Escherichia phage UoN_LG358_1]
MADIWCSAAPEVNVRCQFDHVPGVTHINIRYQEQRGQNVFCKINFSCGNGPEISLTENDINYILMEDIKSGTLGLFNENVAGEIAEAVDKGLRMLRTMVLASKKGSNK